MPVVSVRFDLSLQVEGRLKHMAERSDIGQCVTAARCIGVAHNVMQKWLQNARFYIEGGPLKMPLPVQLTDPVFAPFHLNILKENFEKFQEIQKQYKMDEHSALAWGLACVELIEETIMTDQIFVRGSTTEPDQLDLEWLK